MVVVVIPKFKLLPLTALPDEYCCKRFVLILLYVFDVGGGDDVDDDDDVNCWDVVNVENLAGDLIGDLRRFVEEIIGDEYKLPVIVDDDGVDRVFI